ncbi:MAG: hypothetical protein QOD77_1329 [Thermoplasmata archaeon]|nr:hypothetical protein [Thermoplasmata archaeon]
MGNQEAVRAFVARNPGCRIRDVAQQLLISHSTATYHLGVLVRSRQLVCRRDGRDLRHYAAGVQPSGVAALVRDPRRRALLAFLVEGPLDGLSLNQVARATGLGFGVVKRILGGLGDEGYLQLTRRNSRYAVRLEPAQAARLREQVRSPPDGQP